VMSKDRKGLAVLMDAMLFLMVLTVLCACLMMPMASIKDEGPAISVKDYHSVMLGGEVPGGDGSAMSQTSLSSFIIMIAKDGAQLSAFEMERLEMAVNGTLQEMENMGLSTWWTLSVDGEEHVFGQKDSSGAAYLYADRQVLSEDPCIICTLSATV
jgi:hypothetical protein